MASRNTRRAAAPLPDNEYPHGDPTSLPPPGTAPGGWDAQLVGGDKLPQYEPGKRYNVLVPHEYRGAGGEICKVFTNVGVAFPHKSGRGVNIEIRQGVSISGSVVILEDDPDRYENKR